VNVVVVGASGLLGAHLVEEALARGCAVIAIARKFPLRSGAHHLKDRVRLIEADVTAVDPAELRGADVLVNAAARVEASAEASLVSQSVELLQTVASLRERAGIAEFVHVSSVATLSDGTPGKTVSETDHGQGRDTPYAQGKLLCDQWIERKLGPTLTIHPCYLLGRWDAKPSSGSILLALQMGKLRGGRPGKKNFVHARDVARGLFDAQAAQLKERFVLGGENWDSTLFLEECLRQLGAEKSLPLMSDQEFSEATLAREFFSSNAVDDGKARAAFAYAPRVSVQDAIAETIAYFREYRLLPKVRVP